ncbi:hypothetical protein CANINC_003582 [Pichia inconspicua]|uniref:BHLH domain-containing protein n=1 Tax=Pichia inconspicua TaxID=52247 RepID=A0A4T0WYD9_9ASCO|nr:hypothetical protein CANINC_003582 [[Candida] inconspicua]
MSTPQPFMLPPPPVFRPKNPTLTDSPSLTASYVDDKVYAASPLLHGSSAVSPIREEPEIILPLTTTTTPNNSSTTPRKRRRRRSAADAAAAAATVKHQHSAIEKRRRVKINREFEALKFIVPACRATVLQAQSQSQSHSQDPNNSIDTSAIMHKLTILQSTVEYIQYLHLIIKLLKVQMLVPPQTRSFFKKWLHANNDLTFANYDLPIVEYRDLTNDYNFNNLYLELAANDNKIPSHWLDPVTKKIDLFTADNLTNTTTVSSPLNSPNSNSNSNIDYENKLYRHSILQLQNDESSFKLPLPAIIDKYPSNKSATIIKTDTDTDHASLLLDFKRSSSTSTSSTTSPLLPPLSRHPSISNMLN